MSVSANLTGGTMDIKYFTKRIEMSKQIIPARGMLLIKPLPHKSEEKVTESGIILPASTPVSRLGTVVEPSEDCSYEIGDTVVYKKHDGTVIDDLLLLDEEDVLAHIVEDGK